MRLSEVQLTNFRCFESLEIKLDPRQNLLVFVGDNGAGKSAILDAIALGLAPIAKRFSQPPGGKPRGVLEIMEVPRHASHGVAVFEDTQPKPFCHLRFAGTISERHVEWDTHQLRDKSKRTKAVLPPLLEKKQLYAALDDDVFHTAERSGGTVPVFAYYGTSRAVIDIPQRQRDFQSGFSREAALRNALDPVSRFKDAFEWFFAMERDELAMQKKQENHRFRLPVLEAVRRAISLMIPEFAEPRITTHPLHFELSRKNDDGTVTDLYAEQLSDGYRTMLALVMDFARRLAQANPHFEDPLGSEAVLLIDEVDLHLHPDWQQTIVPQLQRTFPNTQMILTTHSPAVLTSVHSECIRILRSGSVLAAPGGIYGAESKRAMERIMNIPSRPPESYNERVRDLQKLFALIDRAELKEAKLLATSLGAAFSGNEPAVDEAMTMIENRLWEEEVGL